MRIAVAVLAILWLMAGFSAGVAAQGYAKKRHKHAKAQVRQPASRAQSSNAPSDYIVRDSNQLPVGSSIWWDQMLRENRAGTCCN
jgi:hypothetical protein